METVELLPDKVLQRQVCQECFQYLSVPPITINNHGDTICGRCFDDSDNAELEGRKSTMSIYNVLAKRFWFKCTNHFNGCTKILNMAQTAEHEEKCNYQKQECFFCSFSGNLSQILNHSLKFHSKNISLDGTFSFRLGDMAFKKRFLLLKYNTIFVVAVGVKDDLFTATVFSATKTDSSSINQYGVKFFERNNPLNFDFIHTDYGLLNANLVKYEKNVNELNEFFGPGARLSCQILLGRFSLDEKELEVQRRFAKLRQSEAELNKLKQILEVQKLKLSHETEVHNTAMNIIKKMSCNIFKCCLCENNSLANLYYCSKMHCYCKNCLTSSMCKLCNMIREFKKLENVDALIVSCDWPGCSVQLKLEDYLKHKSMCSERPYKCPLQDCQEVVFSSEGLIEHWHSDIPELISGDSITYNKYEIKECYWLLSNNDLYRILINFDQTIIQVLIDEVNVLSNGNTLVCTGIAGVLGSQVLQSKSFCSQFHVNVNSTVYISGRNCPVTSVKISRN